MNAIVYTKFGTPDQLQLKEVEKPIPKKREVLVKVMATSINSWDADNLLGRQFLVRLLSGFSTPRYPVLGADVAGIVESTGSEVSDFNVGDEVFGDNAEGGFGALAEYVTVPEKLLSKKSPKMTFQQAAALPQAGLLALQGLRYGGEIRAGQKVLINGAGGGVGTLALQYAKSIGAEATCVDHSGKEELLRSLGADHFIDYQTEDYTNSGKTYHKILDVIAHRPASHYNRALTPDGTFAMIGGSMGLLLLRMMIVEPFLSLFRKKKIGIMGYRVNRKELDNITQLFEEGTITPIIDKSFVLKDTAEAFRYFLTAAFKGKIIIEIATADSGK
jgi:NADPH:quinone reductase-like Zn-dependent oxidoreductase